VILDEVLALAAEGDRLGVLGRRTVTAFDGSGQRIAEADLTRLASASRSVPRRPVGAIAPGDDGAWDLWSTFLDEGSVFQFRTASQEGLPRAIGFLPPSYRRIHRVDVEPPLGGITGARENWPGPVLEIPGEDGSVLLHLDQRGHLAADPSGAVTEDPIGEPLAFAPERGGWVVYVSAPVLPGEPDRILEYEWDGIRFRAGRRSVPFPGRVSAALRVDARMVVAVAEPMGMSRLYFVDLDELWEEETE
jgi:hypothetical protein